MNSNQWIKRFRKLWYMPSTPEGNPLYKRSEETNDKNILKIAETDKDYDKMVSKTWTSPSNVRAIFIGVNKAFILFHRGLSEGSDSKKVLEVNVKGEEWIYPIPGIVDGSNSLYHIDLKHCSKDSKTNLPIPDPDKSKYDTFSVEKDPLGSSINRFIFSNLETVLVSWTALSVSNFNNAGVLKDYIKELSDKSKRWQGAYYLKDNADEFLGKYEQNIRDFAKEKFKTIEEFIPEISQYQIDKAENNLKQNLSLQPKQWPYDNFLAGWNTSLAKEDFENKQNKEENKSEDDLKDLVCLNKGFLHNYKGNNGIEVQKRDDYTVKISLCEPGRDYYNDLKDVHYKSDPSKVVITGTASEQWLTKPQKVIDTYVKLDGSPITKEDFMNLGKGILEVKPKSNSDKCFAYHIPADQRDKFYITTSWGDNLKINATYAKGTQNRIEHGDGDWVICYGKDGKPNIEDQSVINGLVFRNTYKKYEEQLKENNKEVLNLETISKKVWKSINEDKDENYFEKINDRKYLITDNGEATYEFISDKENKALIVRIDESEKSEGKYKTIYGPKKFEDVNIDEIIYNISKLYKNSEENKNGSDDSILTDENKKFLENLEKEGWKAPEGITNSIINEIKEKFKKG